MRLGEYLVEKGIISEEQLKKALAAQLIYGAHLGTCLIELGYLEEDVLGEILADLLRVRYVQPELLEDIPPQVISALPQTVVERRQAIPFDLKDKILHVAMVDPKNLMALDEIAFVSGCRVEPWISPEVRVFQAMERYYEVPRKIRYIALARRLDERHAEGGPRRQQKQAAATTMTIAVGTAAVPGGGAPSVVTSRRAAEWEAAPDAGRKASAEGGFDEVSDQLCRAQDKGQVAKAILDCAQRGARRCILFGVKDEAAIVWDARGIPLTAKAKETIAFPLTTEPLFALPMGEPFYRGPVRHEPRCQAFYKTLGIEAPAEILLIPVHLNDRIAALFYADGGPKDGIEGATDAFERLTRKLSLALSLLILKRKIRAD